MESRKNKRYDKELRAQVLKEVGETKNAAVVARSHGLKYSTVASWIRAERKAPAKREKAQKKAQQKRLEKLELENRILKELLKKTNQVWLSEDEWQKHS